MHHYLRLLFISSLFLLASCGERVKSYSGFDIGDSGDRVVLIHGAPDDYEYKTFPWGDGKIAKYFNMTGKRVLIEGKKGLGPDAYSNDYRDELIETKLVYRGTSPDSQIITICSYLDGYNNEEKFKARSVGLGAGVKLLEEKLGKPSTVDYFQDGAYAKYVYFRDGVSFFIGRGRVLEICVGEL